MALVYQWATAKLGCPGILYNKNNDLNVQNGD
jgi:hypothetical protein